MQGDDFSNGYAVIASANDDDFRTVALLSDRITSAAAKAYEAKNIGEARGLSRLLDAVKFIMLYRWPDATELWHGSSSNWH